MMELLELSDRDFKEAIIQMPQWPITNTFETNKKKILVKKFKKNKINFRTEKCNNPDKNIS